MRKKWPKPDAECTVPLYGGRVYRYDDREAYAAALAFLNCPEELAPTAGRCHMLINKTTGERTYLVACHDGEASTLAHEVAHLTFFVLARAGIDPRESSGEVFCYLFDDLLVRLGFAGVTRPAPPEPTA